MRVRALTLLAAASTTAVLGLSACTGSTGSAANPAPAVSSSAGAGGSGGSSATVPAATQSGGSGSSGSAAPAGSGGCSDVTVTGEVKSAVLKAYAATVTSTRLTHIESVPGTFLYGDCGGTPYAAVKVRATAGASVAEQTALQDEGSVRQYFRFGDSGWEFLGNNGFPDHGGCPSELPAGLARIWGNCPA